MLLLDLCSRVNYTSILFLPEKLNLFGELRGVYSKIFTFQWDPTPADGTVRSLMQKLYNTNNFFLILFTSVLYNTGSANTPLLKCI